MKVAARCAATAFITICAAQSLIIEVGGCLATIAEYIGDYWELKAETPGLLQMSASFLAFLYY